MCDRLLANRRVRRAPSQSVSPITNQLGTNGLIRQLARNQSQVLPHRVVLSELPNDVGLSAFMTSKYQQAAGVPIDSMDGEKSWQSRLDARVRSAGGMPGNQLSNGFVQRGLLASSL